MWFNASINDTFVDGVDGRLKIGPNGLYERASWWEEWKQRLTIIKIKAIKSDVAVWTSFSKAKKCSSHPLSCYKWCIGTFKFSSFQTCIVFQVVLTTISTYLDDSWLLVTSVFISSYWIMFWILELAPKENTMVSFGKSQISVWHGKSFSFSLFLIFHFSAQKIRC